MDETVPDEPSVETSSAQPKPKKNIWKIILMIAIGMVVIALIWFAWVMYFGFANKDAVEAKINQYMQQISAGDIRSVYNDLSSATLKENMTYDQFNQAFSAMPCAFTGFRKLDFAGFNIYQGTEGTIYTYRGTVTYSNNDQGNLVAILEKDNGDWEITTVHIDVSPQRFKTLCVSVISSSTVQ